MFKSKKKKVIITECGLLNEMKKEASVVRPMREDYNDENNNNTPESQNKIRTKFEV